MFLAQYKIQYSFIFHCIFFQCSIALFFMAHFNTLWNCLWKGCRTSNYWAGVSCLGFWV